MCSGQNRTWRRADSDDARLSRHLAVGRSRKRNDCRSLTLKKASTTLETVPPPMFNARGAVDVVSAHPQPWGLTVSHQHQPDFPQGCLRTFPTARASSAQVQVSSGQRGVHVPLCVLPLQELVGRHPQLTHSAGKLTVRSVLHAATYVSPGLCCKFIPGTCLITCHDRLRSPSCVTPPLQPWRFLGSLPRDLPAFQLLPGV